MSICAASENAIEVVVAENAIKVVTENDIKVVTENDIEAVYEIAIELVTDNDIETVSENDIEVVSEIEVASESAINVIPHNSIEWMKPKKIKKLRKLFPARKTQKVIGIGYDSKYILNNHFKGRKS